MSLFTIGSQFWKVSKLQTEADQGKVYRLIQLVSIYFKATCIPTCISFVIRPAWKKEGWTLLEHTYDRG